MTEAIEAYRNITATSEFQEIERLRSKARHDEAQALRHAKREKGFEVARNALRKNMSIEDIADITGLTREEIENMPVRRN